MTPILLPRLWKARVFLRFMAFAAQAASPFGNIRANLKPPKLPQKRGF